MKKRITLLFVLVVVSLLALFVGCSGDPQDNNSGNNPNCNTGGVVEPPQGETETVTFTVTFKNADGTVLDVQEVPQGGSATAPTQPTMNSTADKSYTFKEWSADFSNVQSNLTITAVYTESVRQYSVTFKDNAGNILTSSQVDYNGYAQEPTLNLSDSQGFIGWYKDSECLTEYVFGEDTVTTDMEIYAKLTDVSMLTFTLKDDSTYEVTSALTEFEGEIYIPYKYKNAIVSSIGEQAFYYCSGITNIEIPQSISTISNGAFAGCSSLTSIELPDQLSSLGSAAFQNCSNITSIVIPETITALPTNIFLNCSNLAYVTLHEKITAINDYAFKGCRNLESLTIPQSATYLGVEALRQCSKLTEITIPNNITELSQALFSECTSLTNVYLPDSLEVIGASAFYKCTSLTQFNFPSGLREIKSYAFSACSGLENISMPSGLMTLGSSVFQVCTNLKAVTIPGSLTSIGGKVFERCSALQTINIMMSQSRFEQLTLRTNWDTGIPYACNINYYG